MNKYEENTSFAEQRTSAADVCANCGAALEAGQTFCPKCGAPKKTPERSVCVKCGAELQNGQEFCPNCGQKVALAGNAAAGRKKSPAKKKVVAIAIIAGAVILLAALAVIFAPKIFVFKSTEEYLEMGDYEKAYRAAKTKQDKLAVIGEDAIAFCTKLASKRFESQVYYFYGYCDTVDSSNSAHLIVNLSAVNLSNNDKANHLYYAYNKNESEWRSITHDEYKELHTQNGKYFFGNNISTIEWYDDRINDLLDSHLLDDAEFLDLDKALNEIEK